MLPLAFALLLQGMALASDPTLENECQRRDCAPSPDTQYIEDFSSAEVQAEGADADNVRSDTPKRHPLDNEYGVDRFGRSKYDAAQALDDMIALDLSYEPCVLDAAERLAISSSEQATVIAEAALGQCEKVDEAWRRAADRVLPGDTTPRIIMLSEDRRATSRLKAVAKIVEVRSR